MSFIASIAWQGVGRAKPCLPVVWSPREAAGTGAIEGPEECH